MSLSQFSVCKQQSEMSGALIASLARQYHTTHYDALFDEEETSLVIFYRAAIAREKTLSRSELDGRGIFLKSNQSLGKMVSVL